MKRVQLGETGIEISRLGLGTVKFGRNQQVKYPTAFELPSDAEIQQLLDVARESGINLLDTAPAYGVSEERLGKILTEREDADFWVIGSKAGEEFVDGESVFDFSPEFVRNSVERSLRRLGRERLDILLLHSDGEDVRILEESGAVEALTELKREGKLGAIGISTKTVEGGCLAFKLELDVVMATYNPWHTAEKPVLDAAAAAGRSVLIKKALGSGWLGRDAGKSIEEQVGEAFDFIFAHPGATAAIVGTINPENLKLNARLVDSASSKK